MSRTRPQCPPHYAGAGKLGPAACIADRGYSDTATTSGCGGVRSTDAPIPLESRQGCCGNTAAPDMPMRRRSSRISSASATSAVFSPTGWSARPALVLSDPIAPPETSRRSARPIRHGTRRRRLLVRVARDRRDRRAHGFLRQRDGAGEPDRARKATISAAAPSARSGRRSTGGEVGLVTRECSFRYLMPSRSMPYRMRGANSGPTGRAKFFPQPADRARGRDGRPQVLHL